MMPWSEAASHMPDRGGYPDDRVQGEPGSYETRQRHPGGDLAHRLLRVDVGADPHDHDQHEAEER
jgi:hypothetical protein